MVVTAPDIEFAEQAIVMFKAQTIHEVVVEFVAHHEILFQVAVY